MVFLLREIQSEFFIYLLMFLLVLLILVGGNYAAARITEVHGVPIMGFSTQERGQCRWKDIQTMLPRCENNLNTSLAEHAEVNKTRLPFFCSEMRLTNVPLCHAEGKQFFSPKQSDSVAQ